MNSAMRKRRRKAQEDEQAIGRFLRGILFDFLPFLSVLFLILITALPLGLPQSARTGGMWPLMGITYWTLVRTRNMPPLLVFILGLITDGVTFAPFGVHAAVFIVAQSILRRQRRFLIGQGFWVLWAAYAVLAISAYVVLTVLIDILTPGTLMMTGALWGVALSWASLPLILALLHGLHEMIDLFDEPVV